MGQKRKKEKIVAKKKFEEKKRFLK